MKQQTPFQEIRSNMKICEHCGKDTNNKCLGLDLYMCKDCDLETESFTEPKIIKNKTLVE